MAKTLSTMLALGTPAPAFQLPNPAGQVIDKAHFAGKPLLVIFTCNHCPYVKHIRANLAEFARTYQAKGLAVVAINSNDFEKYPDDAPAKMAEEIQAHGFTFPYLVDATQAVAQAYKAACTPDFFLFDAAHTLVYRGQYDDARPGNSAPVTGADLRRAANAVLAQQPVSGEQRASIGCNIKWKAGNAPAYFAS